MRKKIQKSESFPIIFRHLLTPDDMRKTEQLAFDAGMPSILLMEHAALQVIEALEKELGGDCREKRVVFLCGTGNNGGDGLAAARLFQMRGGYPEIWLSGDPKTPDAKTNFKLAQACRIDVLNLSKMPREEWPFDDESFVPHRHHDGYVDALLGIGMKGEPDFITSAMILAPYHDFGRHTVIAVDVPSGMDALTGNCPGAYMHADVTVTFHGAKPGLYLSQDRDAVGRIVIADIGLEDWDCCYLDEKELDMDITTPAHLMTLPGRFLDTHKGDCGRILIYAGSMGMAGAAAMCAKAAVCAGAGLVTVACPKEIIPILQTLAPNAMCMDIEEAVKKLPAWDVLAVGCGLSQSEENWDHIMQLFNPAKPSVWDADALNMLAKHPMKLGAQAVITPHPGEAARLLQWDIQKVLDDRIAAARALAEKFGCIAVLKSDVTILCRMTDADPRYFFNALGTPAMAKGGSGDALTGMMAVLLHQMGGSLLHAAALACAWHGMAGIMGERKYGLRQLTTGQLIDCLHEAEKWGRGEISSPEGWEDC